MKVKSENEVAQSCTTLSNPMDCSLPGSSIHGIFQARVLEWGAIAFSNWSINISQFYMIRVNSVLLCAADSSSKALLSSKIEIKAALQP